MDIYVHRYTGNTPGDDIIEPLLGESIAAALARGRNELDTQAEGVQSTNITGRYVSAARLGLLVAFDDVDVGGTVKAKITGIRHTIGPTSSGRRVETQVTVARRSEFKT